MKLLMVNISLHDTGGKSGFVRLWGPGFVRLCRLWGQIFTLDSRIMI